MELSFGGSTGTPISGWGSKGKNRFHMLQNWSDMQPELKLCCSGSKGFFIFYQAHFLSFRFKTCGTIHLSLLLQGSEEDRLTMTFVLKSLLMLPLHLFKIQVSLVLQRKRIYWVQQLKKDHDGRCMFFDLYFPQ